MARDEGRRGRQPLPAEKRGETLSCYIPRWAVARLQELADGERLTRNGLVRQILIDYLAAAGGAPADARGAGRRGTEARS